MSILKSTCGFASRMQPGVDVNGVNFHAVGKVEPIIRISRRRLGRESTANQAPPAE